MKCNQTKKCFKVLLLVAMTVSLFATNIVSTASASTPTQAQLDAAKKQAAAAKAAADQKAAEKVAVNSQINTLASQISSLQDKISETTNQISDTQTQVAELNVKISNAEANLKVEQGKMDNLLVAWYTEDNNSGLFNAIITSNSLSEVITKDEYFGSVQEQISAGMEKINALKADLAKQKSTQEAQLMALNDMKNSQLSQQDLLQSKKHSKDQLLSGVTSVLSDLQSQQKAAEDQVAKLTKAIQDAYNSYGIGASGIHHGGGGNSLDVPYFSQRNPQWSGMSLGDSGYSIGAFGCLISSYAMVASYFNNYNTPADIDNKSTFDSEGNFMYFNQDMGKLNNYRYRQSVNLAEIDSQLQRGNPVIVGISFPGVPQHWIVLTGGTRAGGYSWNDPYPVDASRITSFIAMRTFD